MSNKTITEEQAQEILDAFYDLDGSLGDDPIKRDYSGRGMYGKVCFGFRLESDTSLLLLGVALSKALGEDNEEVAIALARVAQTDTLGLGGVVYFPGWTIVNDEDDDEDDATYDDDDKDDDDKVDAGGR